MYIYIIIIIIITIIYDYYLKEDYLKAAHKQLSDEEVYEEVTNDPSTLESTIFTAFNK